MSRTSFRVNPLYSCLNVKELLFARNKHDIWSLSDYNETRTLNHLAINEHETIQPNWSHHLAKVFVYKLSGCGFESRCSHLILCLSEFPYAMLLLHFNKTNREMAPKAQICTIKISLKPYDTKITY